MWDYICKKFTTHESKRVKNNDNGQRKNDGPVATIYANLKNSWATSNQGGPYQQSKLTSHCLLTQNRQTKALQIAILENLEYNFITTSINSARLPLATNHLEAKRQNIYGASGNWEN